MRWQKVIDSLVEERRISDAKHEKLAHVINNTSEKILDEIKEKFLQINKQQEYELGAEISDPTELPAIRIRYLTSYYRVLIEYLDTIDNLYKEHIEAYIDSPKLSTANKIRASHITPSKVEFFRKKFRHEVEAGERRTLLSKTIDDETFTKERKDLDQNAMRILTLRARAMDLKNIIEENITHTS